VRSFGRVMLGTGAFGVVVGVVYWFLTYERAGSVLLVMYGVTALVIAAYVLIRARGRSDPEDHEDADLGEAEGRPVGPFHFASPWPVWLAVGSTLTAAGLAFGLYLVPVGVAVLVLAVLGLMRESRS
jgi:cytochrome c oxidase subunit IV